jgi:hypothetical protein
MIGYPSPIARRKFSAEEDDALKALVSEYGTEDWMLIALRMPRRDSRQCKERWCHYLAPELIQRPWSLEDDALLERRVSEHGHKWKLFENDFPGRTDISIKNRYNVLARRLLRWVRIEGGIPSEDIRTTAHTAIIDDPASVSDGSSNLSDPMIAWPAEIFDWEEFSQA